MAISFFREKPLLAERVVPLLIAGLTSGNRELQEESAKALGSYRADATNAFPILSRLSTNRNRYVASAASNALFKFRTKRDDVSSFSRARSSPFNPDGSFFLRGDQGHENRGYDDGADDE